MSSDLVQTWQIHQRIMRFFIEALSPEQLSAKQAKGKSVGGQFAHCHNVRLMWLKVAAPELMEGLQKVEDSATSVEILSALDASGKAIEALLESARDTQKVKGFKPHATAYVAYLISHESSHRGQAELIMRLSGIPIDDKTGYGIWEWGVR